MNYCVVTTINDPTKAISELHNRFGGGLVIVGDKKTPIDWKHNELKPIQPVDKKYAPDNHYARKNIGYLQAIKNGAKVIYDTDDDNIPNDNWEIRSSQVSTWVSLCKGWYNVYSIMMRGDIWPRGFSLKHINRLTSCITDPVKRQSSIQQGLADGEPDVDAIWRLVMNRANEFKTERSIFLREDTWCPFNSQSTWWFPDAYPLMYLPVYASFRMTDIWRSFIAQRCLWEIGDGVTFHSPSEVFQDRNEHDLLKDFKDEIPGYLNNDLIVETLSALVLKPGKRFVCENLLTCYTALVEKEILPEMEIDAVKEWVKDYENITGVI